MTAALRATVLVHLIVAAWAFVFAFIPAMPLPWWAWLVISAVAVLLAAMCDVLADEREKDDGRIDL